MIDPRDLSMFDSIRSRSRLQLTAGNKLALGQYARRARNCGWSWQDIADAMRVSVSSARYRAQSWR